MEVGGTVDEYTAEILTCISELYASILKYNPGIAGAFRSMIVGGIVAPGSPVWDGKTTEGSELIYSEIPQKG